MTFKLLVAKADPTLPELSVADAVAAAACGDLDLEAYTLVLVAASGTSSPN